MFGIDPIHLIIIFYLLHCRSLTNGLGALGWFTNPVIWLGIGVLLLLQFGFVYVPFMQTLFGTTALPAEAWIRLVLAAAVVLPIISLEKWMRRHCANSAVLVRDGNFSGLSSTGGAP